MQRSVLESKGSDGMYPSSFKRMKFDHEIIDLFDPFGLARYIDELNEYEYGNTTKEFKELHALRMKFINLLPSFSVKPCSSSEPPSLQVPESASSQPSGLSKVIDVLQPGRNLLTKGVIKLDSDSDVDGSSSTSIQFSKGERQLHATVGLRQPLSIQYEKVSLKERTDVCINENPGKQLVRFRGLGPQISFADGVKKKTDLTDKKLQKEKKLKKEQKLEEKKIKEEKNLEEKKLEEEKAINITPATPIPLLSSEEHSQHLIQKHQDVATEVDSDGLEDLWNDMSLAIECSKDVPTSAPVEKEEECCHSFILKDDLGIVCQVCGVIQKSIETIFDFQWIKNTRETRHNPGSGTQKHGYVDEAVDGSNPTHRDEDAAVDLCIDPRHRKLMRPHQTEGFRFLVQNLMVEKPGGCILAHAPGSGKTFMLISFIQSFITQKPDKRPLVVLPKGIVPTWKREFQLWQLEDIPLFDFYSVKADHRSQQLDVLKSWEQTKSILFLGYKQFTNIVSSSTGDRIDAMCREKLLMVPGLVVLDEGHTPRNSNTALVHSLSRIQTPRKVVLSGTLFQNHVKEVFNILKLVRPKFMKEETSRNVMKRVLSSVEISPGRRPSKSGKESVFCDLVHETLQNDDNLRRKYSVINDLREMTHNVLHYYRGDFLDELPGLVDFTVFLRLTQRQKSDAGKLQKLDVFRGNSVGSAVYVHPNLKEVAESVGDGEKGDGLSEDRIDGIVGSLIVRDGVKTKFFLSVLSLSESASEKLLVYSQYILPLRFLERLTVRKKGWRIGKEIFMISGDSSSEEREWAMERFNNSADSRVLFGSIRACGEGISLVGASRILILDVHLNPSVTRQAIGRAFRPGQRKKVYAYRLVAADSPEEEHHNTSFKKEMISKLWFEWKEGCGRQETELREVDVSDSGDVFLESTALTEDIERLHTR